MIKLLAKPRIKLGTAESRRLRRAGEIPATVYGPGKEPKTISLKAQEFEKHFKSPRSSKTLELEIDGKAYKVLITDFQYDYTKNRVEHLDFLELDEKRKVKVQVPVAFSGVAEGVKEGGSLFVIKRELRVRAFFKDIPECIPMALDKLKIGEYLRVSDIKGFDNIEFLEDKKQVLLSVTGKIKEKSAE